MRSRALASLAVALCLGCAPPPDKAKTAVVPGKVPDAIPGEAGLVILLGSPIPMTDEVMKSQMTEAELKDLEDELFGFLETRTGLKLAGVKGAAFFAWEDGGAALIDGVDGKLSGSSAGEHEGYPLVRVDIKEPFADLDRDPYEDDYDDYDDYDDGDDETAVVAVQVGNLLIIGNDLGARYALEAALGKRENLKKTDPKLVSLVEAEAAGGFIVVGVSSAQLDREARAQASLYGIDRGVISMRKNAVRAIVEGDDDGLKRLADLMKDGLKSLSEEVGGMKTKATAKGSDSGALEGLALIFGAHYTKHIEKVLQPKVSSGRLEVSLPLPSDTAMTVIPIMGMLAATAIPAFLNYMKIEKSVASAGGSYEAESKLRSIYDGARAYYADQQAMSVSGEGRFPDSVGPTPPLGECCSEGGRCAPAAHWWREPSWESLQFTVDDPHAYSYELRSSGSGNTSAFTAYAYGDLDCDGTYSTFEMQGGVEYDGTFSGTPTVRRENENE